MNSFIIALNVIRRLLREIKTFGFIFLFPIFCAVIAIIMFAKPAPIQVGIANVPENDFGIVKLFEDGSKYNVQIVKEDQIEKRINDKHIKIGLIFLDDFGKYVYNANNNKIKLITLKSDDKIHQLYNILNGYIYAVTSQDNTKINMDDIKKYFELDWNSNDFGSQQTQSIGMLSMFTIMFASTGIGLLLEDKRCKTFMRTFCAPVKSYEMVFGNILANILLGTLQITIFLFTTTLIFKIDWQTSLLNIFIVLFIFLITSIGFAIGIAGIINKYEIYDLVLTSSACVTCFLSGCFFPLKYMGQTINKIANFIPQKWLLDSYIKLASGCTLLDIQINLGIMLLFALVFFTFGVGILKPGIEDM